MDLAQQAQTNRILAEGQAAEQQASPRRSKRGKPIEGDDDAYVKRVDHYLAAKHRILSAVNLVNRESVVQLTYLFMALINKGEYVQNIYLQGCKLVEHNETLFCLMLKAIQKRNI